MEESDGPVSQLQLKLSTNVHTQLLSRAPPPSHQPWRHCKQHQTPASLFVRSCARTKLCVTDCLASSENHHSPPRELRAALVVDRVEDLRFGAPLFPRSGWFEDVLHAGDIGDGWCYVKTSADDHIRRVNGDRL
jgi:hypothetical protein